MRFVIPSSWTVSDAAHRRAPLALLGVAQGQRIDVRVANRQNEEYTAPPKVQRAFEGQGNRLGAPSPAAAASSAAPSSQSASQPTQPASTLFQVDGAQPTTNLQIRLGDGSRCILLSLHLGKLVSHLAHRIVQRFNHTHTVGDIMGYINACVRLAPR